MMIQEAALATITSSRHEHLCTEWRVHIHNWEYDPDFRTASCPFFLGSTALLPPPDIHGLLVPGLKAKHFLCTPHLCSHNGLGRGHQLAMPRLTAELSERVSLLSNLTQLGSGETWIWSHVFWTPSPNLLALSLEVSKEVCTDRHSQSQTGEEFQVLISCL